MKWCGPRRVEHRALTVGRLIVGKLATAPAPVANVGAVEQRRIGATGCGNRRTQFEALLPSRHQLLIRLQPLFPFDPWLDHGSAPVSCPEPTSFWLHVTSRAGDETRSAV